MIYSLITAYYPDESFIKNLISISKQSDKVFISENTPVPNIDFYKNIPENCIVCFNKQNLGLSKAFNIILKNIKYRFSDSDFIIFFDDDSFIKDNHISKLIEEYKSIEKKGYKIGTLAPVFYSHNDLSTIKIPGHRKIIDKNIYSVDSTITSSLLITYNNLKRINFWDENIFLDNADVDLCCKIKQKKMINCITKNVLLEHNLGDGQRKTGPIKQFIESPIREYYMTRDGLKMLIKTSTTWRLKLIIGVNITLKFLLRLLFTDNVKERKYYYRLAWRDFLLNRKGPINI